MQILFKTAYNDDIRFLAKTGEKVRVAIVVLFVLRRKFAPPLASLVRRAVKTGDLEPVLAALAKKRETAQPTAFNEAIVGVRTTKALAAEKVTVIVIDDLHDAPDEGLAMIAALAWAVISFIASRRPGTSYLSRCGLHGVLPFAMSSISFTSRSIPCPRRAAARTTGTPRSRAR